MNLKMIPELARKYRVVSGLSDHTTGIEAPVAATALGASIIEKHFILDKTIGGPDASFSLDMDEFSAMVKAVRQTEQMLGQISNELTETALASRAFARSLYVAEDIPEGAVTTAGNIRSVRPGHGLPPKYLPQIIGRRVRRALKKGTPLRWEDLE
jgi:pseudaminic acid synthase